MRNAKFRAWDDINKRWLLGYEYPSLGGFSMFGEVMIGGEYTHMLNSFSIEDWDKIKLTQFVDLKDKNGKEAYVGTLYKETLLNGEERFFKIFNVKGGFAINQFQNDFYKDPTDISFYAALSDMQTSSWFESCLEEIGNIFENPELLKQ